MTWIWRHVRAYGVDALVAIAAVEAAVEVVLRQDAAQAPDISPWLAVPALVLVVLSLLGRRRFPFAAPAAVWILAAALSFVDGRLVTFTASVFIVGFAAAFLLGNLHDARQARSGLAVVLGGAVLVVYNDPSHAAADLVFNPLLFGIGWLAGYAMRERVERAESAEQRADQAERDREAAARVAVAEERARIARELHDIVAHAVSVMVLQVGAVRHKLPNGLDEEQGALTGVERTGRTALTDMRRLLGAMRREDDDVALAPQAGVADLRLLADQAAGAGLSVRLHTDGAPYPLPQGLDLSAYRIVQEGVTNALKHAHAEHADVTLRYREDELCIEVLDDGDGPSGGDGLGHGLVGIRERVKIYGGEMSADPASGGGFALRARLPVRDQVR